MARPGPADDEERLPWLEPYRDAKAVKAAPVASKSSRGGLLAVVGAVAVLVAAGGGYIIGQRKPTPVMPTAEIAIKPVVATARVAPPAAPPVAAVVEQAAPPPAPATYRPVVRAAQTAPHRAPHFAYRQRKIRSAGIEAAQIRAVRAAQERRTIAAPTPRVAYRPWPKMPSPGPAGQVIQLGAFTSPTHANAALRLRLARYPALGRMPRVVVPVITRPRGQILYVLRLGTTSRQQSSIVCRNLRASGDHCLVIG